MRCSVFIATSVDGYIARADGGLDWLDRVASPDTDYGYAAFAATVDVLVMGRATYDVVRGFNEWPYGDKRVIVMTSRPADHETFSGEPVALVARLRTEGIQRAYIDGGNVIRQFLAADLIDDLTLSIIPVVLGDGIPLWGPGTGEHALEVVDTRAYPSGLVQLRYAKSRR
jgi:dihydrofolate reductase